jgi:predicted Zn-ribbon and HTH transcriptional regulator
LSIEGDFSVLHKTKENYINLDNVPLKKHGNKHVYNWEKCINIPAKFKYKETEGILYITYLRKKKTGAKKTSLLNIKFKTYEQNMVPSMILSCSFGGMLKYKTSDYYYDIGDIVNGSKVLNKIKIDDRGSSVKAYKMLCMESNGTFEMRENGLKSGQKSPYLRGYKVGPGNSLFNEKHILKHLKYIEDAHKYHRKSGKKIMIECKGCGFEKYIQITDLVKYGFSCPFCTKGISFPERYMAALLNINGIEYEFQKSFQTLNRKKFDFYLPNQNCVIEMNGSQHYKESDFLDYERTKQSDIIKKEFCIRNDVLYIPIDCSFSTFEFVEHNIKQSPLIKILNRMDKQEISDKMIEMFITKDLKKLIKDYKNGMSYKNIISKYDVRSKYEIISIVKKYGVYEYINGADLNSKSVICMNNNKVFKSVKDAMVYANLKSSSHIVQVCRGKRKQSGKHPISGEPLRWMYYEDYINQQETYN